MITPTHQTIPYQIQAIQWIKGTTTIDQVTPIWASAYVDGSGDLWISRDGMTATVVADQTWVFLDQGGALNLSDPASFSAQYVPIQ